MPASYIVRADLARGEMTRSHAGEVGADVLAETAAALDLIVAGQPAPVPTRAGYWLTGAARGKSLIVTLDAGQRPQAAPLLTVAVCLRSRDSARLWAMLHEGQKALLTRADDPPAAPWMAERIEAGALDHMAAMRWSGSLARAVAWAWMEYHNV